MVYVCNPRTHEAQWEDLAFESSLGYEVRIYMYICMCVYACMRVCMHACMYVCTHVCMYVYMYVCKIRPSYWNVLSREDMI